MTLPEKLTEMESLLCALKNTASANTRKRLGKKMLSLMSTDERLARFWDYDSHHYWINRFSYRAPKCAWTNDDDKERYYNAPRKLGLYFLGMVNTNPITNETFYWVKIGFASDIHKRMGAYNTHCPMYWHIDFLQGNAQELEFQRKLERFAIASCYHNVEWYQVDKQTYLEMCDKGFSYFN